MQLEGKRNIIDILELYSSIKRTKGEHSYKCLSFPVKYNEYQIMGGEADLNVCCPNEFNSKSVLILDIFMNINALQHK